MRVYLASRYSRRTELGRYAQDLRDREIAVTSRWLDGEPGAPEQATIAGPHVDFWANMAVRDVCDVRAADVLVLFSDTSPHGTRGGCHFELGVAWQAGAHTVVVGKRPHIFAHMPGFVVFETWEEALEYLEGLAA